MDSNKEMQDLINSVYIPMVCYFPSRILELSPNKVPDGIGTSPLFNTLFIVKENGESALYMEIYALEIYKKEHVFNSNVFKLLEIKGRNNADAFKFLIEKYISQVRSYDDAFIWIYENVEQDVANVSVSALNNLQFQKDITGQHLNELEKRFPDYNSVPTESLESLLTNTKITTNCLEEQIRENTILESTLGEPQNHKHKTQKRKKVVLATTDEVDEYLLKTVFNVKIPQKTTKSP